jgi:prophage regulatory protein
MQPSTQFLSVRQVADRYSIAPVTVWRWVREGQFPAPYRFAPRTTRWREADLAEFDKRAGAINCNGG